MARKTKQQAQQTREQLLDSALNVFSERGVSSTSLADIATAAGVTRGAIYWHFKNKVDLFNEIWQRSHAKINQLELTYQAKFPDDPLRVLKELLTYILIATVDDHHRRALMEIVFHKCEFVGEMMPLCDARRALYSESYQRIEQVLITCIHHKQLPLDLHTRRATVLLRAYMTGLMENWLFMPESFDLKSDASLLVDAFIDLIQLSPSLRQPISSAGN
ncbi:multidrug efflux transporter transcriptional repressor AcrR [Serratia microhaemolytica]|uniref:multidrug efflux transporter transcriptional repressor AcrR n=1 Tax=Serratia microhaemolytica TaxID=2675110 RepID=UPI000FDE2075|nr:multidrug efflux transporter transcriptional repressor AcrR [Serratia microhaemolytica]